MKHLLYLLLIVCAVSCKTERIPTKPVNPATKNLIGKWEWVSSTGGIAGLTITPKTAGYNLSAEFKTNGKAYFYRNDTLQNQLAYTVVNQKTIFSTEPQPVIKYQPEGMEHVIIIPEKDAKPGALILAENVNDGFTVTYIRKK